MRRSSRRAAAMRRGRRAATCRTLENYFRGVDEDDSDRARSSGALAAAALDHHRLAGSAARACCTAVEVFNPTRATHGFDSRPASSRSSPTTCRSPWTRSVSRSPHAGSRSGCWYIRCCRYRAMPAGVCATRARGPGARGGQADAVAARPGRRPDAVGSPAGRNRARPGSAPESAAVRDRPPVRSAGDRRAARGRCSRRRRRCAPPVGDWRTDATPDGGAHLTGLRAQPPAARYAKSPPDRGPLPSRLDGRRSLRFLGYRQYRLQRCPGVPTGSRATPAHRPRSAAGRAPECARAAFDTTLRGRMRSRAQRPAG